MRVLITGSAGFAGHHIVEHILQNTDWEIVGIDSLAHRGDSLRIDTANNWRTSLGRYRFVCHDLRAPISTRLAKQIGPVDYILNVASESHVDRSIEDPVSFCENNFRLAQNMLEYAREAKPLAFVQFSTDEVYGAAPGDTLHAEWSPIIPSNPYAASKAAQEALAISYWRTYGVPVIVTNTMNLFGERQDAEKFIPMLIAKIARGEEVTIHGRPDYIGKRFYIHCRNMADALLFILRRGAPVQYVDSDSLVLPDRWNIVGEIEADNLTVAKLVADVIGKPLNYRLVDFHAARPGHDRRYALDGRKMAEAGWTPPVSFRESLEKVVRWTLDNNNWRDG